MSMNPECPRCESADTAMIGQMDAGKPENYERWECSVCYLTFGGTRLADDSTVQLGFY